MEDVHVTVSAASCKGNYATQILRVYVSAQRIEVVVNVPGTALRRSCVRLISDRAAEFASWHAFGFLDGVF